MSVALAIRRLCEQHKSDKVATILSEAIKTKKMSPYDVPMAALTESFFGVDYSRKERLLKAIGHRAVHSLSEADAIDASSFSNITGQLLITIVKEKYQSADFVADAFFRKIPNPGANLKEHKIPYLSDVTDLPEKLSQQEPYPHTKFQESWVTLPAPEKYGRWAGLGMEMLISDWTGQAQDSAGSVGRAMGYLVETRKLRVLLGITNPYVWNDSALDTYVDSVNAGNYLNALYSTTVTNHEHVNTVEQLFWVMEDPITGRLINVRPSQVLVMPEKRYELKRILGAVEVRSGDTDEATSLQTISPNPLEINYSMYTSAIARQLLIDEGGLSAAEAKQRIYWGDFPKAFMYREVYPMRTDVAPPQNPMEFHQDIVFAVKVSEFGVPCVYDPRYAAFSTGEAT